MNPLENEMETAVPPYPHNMFNEMQLIAPGLYLSGSRPSESLEYMKEQGITHIIQVTDINTPRFPGDFVYKIICVPDMDETNLIKHFPDTFKFIDEAVKKGGKVLVHCQAGASRSVTVVCAYLMKTRGWSAADALLAVQALRPIAGPNEGFMTQLNLYGDIEHDVNVNRTAYRRFLIASNAAQREMYGYIEEMTLAADPLKAARAAQIAAQSATPSTSTVSGAVPGTTSGSPVHRPQQQQQQQFPPLKCKKCRRALVSRDSVIGHSPGQGQNSFQYRKRDATLNITEAIQSDISSIDPAAVAAAARSCQSWFIEPVEWIQELHGMEGKIACPKCDSKLGTFNWAGEQCSCGAWVTPAFMMHKGKVDG